MVFIPPGTFTMGSPSNEPARFYLEGPQTDVTISRGFWMGQYEVTQGEYSSVMGDNPSYFTNGQSFLGSSPVTNELRHPVESVTWQNTKVYCSKLTAQEQAAGRLPPAGYEYRLPTEAEWEYACRAGTRTAFHYGPALRSGMANFQGEYEYPPCGGDRFGCENPSGLFIGRTVEVGSYEPNAWGLYDMHGNVWEWCEDWWVWEYPGGSVTDPTGPATGTYRVIRGGPFLQPAHAGRSARRSGSENPWRRDLGFRVVLAPNNP